MVTWIVVGTVVVAVGLLWWAAWSLHGRLRPLRRALRRLSWRAEQAKRLEARLEVVRATLARLAEDAAAVDPRERRSSRSG